MYLFLKLGYSLRTILYDLLEHFPMLSRRATSVLQPRLILLPVDLDELLTICYDTLHCMHARLSPHASLLAREEGGGPGLQERQSLAESASLYITVGPDEEVRRE